MAAQDPFYLVRDEIQEMAQKVQAAFENFERLSVSDPERDKMLKPLVEECRSVEWQLDELDRAIGVAARDPARFNIDQKEIQSRKSWTDSTRYQMAMIARALEDAASARATMQKEMARRELLRTQNGSQSQAAGTSADSLEAATRTASTDDDRQALIMKEQDQQLDAMSVALARIGGMGMSIHEELGTQDRIIGELNDGMESTMGRLDLIQKRMTVIMKKAGVKGQLVMLGCLLLLFIILVVLLVYT